MSRTSFVQRLFGISPARFIDKCFDKEVCIHRGSLKRLAGLHDAPEWSSIDDLLRLKRDTLFVQTSGQNLVANSTEQARLLYEQNFQIYLKNVQPESASVREWLSGLEDELGLRRHSVQINAFICRGESISGPRLHTDAGDGIVVQIAGKKQWHYKKNVEFTHAPTTIKPGQVLSRKLKDMAERPIPKNVTGTSTVVVEPGAVAYLPWGTWHMARPLTDSIHLDIIWQPDTWANVISNYVKNELAKSPALRRPLTAPRTPQSRSEVEELLALAKEGLARLSQEVGVEPLWEIAQVDPRTEAVRSRRKAEFLGGDASCIRIYTTPDTATEVYLPPPLDVVGRAVLKKKRISIRELEGMNVPILKAKALFNELVRAGLFEVSGPR